MTISFTHIHLMVFELGNEILIIYQTFWNNLSVVTKMGELCEVCDVCDDVVGEELAPFVATLKAFSKVIHACFGKEADPNYREIISDFENCWFDIFIEFDIAFTNKAHIIISHVPQVIARTGRGLFYQSAKFETFWKRYKVLDVQSEQHGQNLLECLLDFNTKNINIKVLTSH